MGEKTMDVPSYAVRKTREIKKSISWIQQL